MWGRRDEPEPSPRPSRQPRDQPPATPTTTPPSVSPSVTGGQTPVPDRTAKAQAQVGKSFLLKGEITGNEDLYVDGEIQGKIDLKGHNLTVGPNGRVQADVTAQSITILGYLEGALRADQKVDIRKTGSVEGDLVTSGIMIEEGAVFRGSIDIVKPSEAGQQPPTEAKSQAAPKAKPEHKAEAKPVPSDPAQASQAEQKNQASPEAKQEGKTQPGPTTPKSKPSKPMPAWEAKQKADRPGARSG